MQDRIARRIAARQGPATEAEQRCKRLEAQLQQIAQTVHQAYHQEQTGTWRECPMGVCHRIRSLLEEVAP